MEGKWVSLLGFCLTSGAGVVGNAPYQVLPTYVEPGIGQTFLFLGQFNPNTTTAVI